MSGLLGRRQVLDLLGAHDIRPSRALGQNFVVDPNTVARIVELAGVSSSDHVVEIGAGVGSLTVGLARAGADVVAIEVDRRLLPILHEVTAGQQVEIVGADAAALDWPTFLAARHGGPWKLVANLPYNVATSLVIDVLASARAVSQLVVMVQREVAERLAAEPGTKAYGIPSVLVANDATAELVARVPPTVFHPRPRVDSAVVRIRRREATVCSVERAELVALVKTGFGQRRKMLRTSLRDRVTPEAFARAGVDPGDRPEALDIEAWCRLAAAASGGPPPGR